MTLHVWAQHFVTELALLLAAQIQLRPPPIRRRRRRRVARARDWAAGFKTREDWLTWCEEDRRNFEREAMGDFFGAFIDTAIAEARLPAMADVDANPIPLRRAA